MTSRKAYIESIMEGMHTMKRQVFASTKGTNVSITPSQWGVVRILMERKELSVKEIAQLLSMSSSAATQLIEGLVKNGILQRKNHAEDRRIQLLSIPTKYKRKISSMKIKVTAQFAKMFEALTDTELSIYADLNKKIVAALPLK